MWRKRSSERSVRTSGNRDIQERIRLASWIDLCPDNDISGGIALRVTDSYSRRPRCLPSTALQRFNCCSVVGLRSNATSRGLSGWATIRLISSGQSSSSTGEVIKVVINAIVTIMENSAGEMTLISRPIY